MESFEKTLTSLERAYQSAEKVIRGFRLDLMYEGYEDEHGDYHSPEPAELLAYHRKELEAALEDTDSRLKEQIFLIFDQLGEIGEDPSEEVFDAVLDNIRALTADSDENSTEIDEIDRKREDDMQATSDGLDVFIDTQILHSEFGSDKRAAWEMALNKYRESGDPEDIVILLRETASSSDDESVKKIIESYLSFLG